MTRCNGQPVAKISDEPSKAMDYDPSYVAYLREVFQVPEVPAPPQRRPPDAVSRRDAGGGRCGRRGFGVEYSHGHDLLRVESAMATPATSLPAVAGSEPRRRDRTGACGSTTSSS